MPVIGNLSVNMSANTASLESAFTRMEKRNRTFGDSAKTGFNKVSSAITDLGLNVLGLDGKFARLAEGALLLGTGGAATVAITGGMLAIGALMRSGSKEADEYQKHLDDIGEKYLKLADAGAQAGRIQILFDQASKRAQLAQLNADVADPNKMADRLGMIQGIKAALFGTGETLADRLSGPLNEQRSRLMAELAGMDSALEAFDKKERDRLAQAGKPAAAALERRLAEQRAALERRLAQQHSDRAELAGWGNRVAGFGGADPASSAIPAILQGEDETGLRRQKREAMLQETMRRQEAAAKFTEEVWKSAAQNIQTALGGTFERLFDGQLKSLSDFGKSVVQIIERTLAQIAAAEVAAGVTSLVRGGLGLAVGGAGGGGGGAVLPTGPSGLGGDASLRASPTIIQNITYSANVHAIDAQDTARFFRRNRGHLAAELAKASRDSIAVRGALSGGR